MKRKIIVILPAYNEEGKVGKVIQKILDQNFEEVKEVLVVNDASTDDTLKESEKAGANVISHKRNLGVASAIRTGIDYAIKNGYEICVVMGADDQDDPSEIPKLVKPIVNDGYDFVQGSRYVNGQRTINMPFSRSVTTRLFSLFFRFVSGFPVTDGSNGFRAFRLNILGKRKIDIWSGYCQDLGRYNLEPYMYLQAIKKGFKVKEVPVTKRYDLIKGYSKMRPFIDMHSAADSLIREFLRIRERDEKQNR